MKVQYQKRQCPDCGKTISVPNYQKHLNTHISGTFKNYVKNEDLENLKCSYCGKNYDNKRSLSQHQLRCKDNPNRLKPSGKPAWNKGLTKETDDRILKQSISVSKTLKGKSTHFQTETTRQKISQARKKYLSENPNKVPYLVNHSSKTSYPETYFSKVFCDQKIDLKYHLQVSKYELDFYNEEAKLDVEIDGEQHYTDKRIYDSDRNRDDFLTQLGWKIFRIRLADWKKYNEQEKQSVISNLKNLLIKGESPSG